MKIDLAYLTKLDQLLTQVDIITSNWFNKSSVAGGAIRDMLLGKEVSDIDVFIEWDKNYEDFEIVYEKAAQKQIKVLTYFPTHAAYADQSAYIYQLESTLFPVPVQLMLCKSIEDTLENFTCSLSKVSYSRYEGLMLTKDFLDSVAKKKMYFYSPKPHYKQKIVEKFPEYEVLNA